MKKAHPLKDVTCEHAVSQVLYRLDPPMTHISWDDSIATYEHVLVSAIDNEWGMETYIFPATEEGEIIDWGELPGSYRGGTDHAEALTNAGYEIAVNLLTND